MTTREITNADRSRVLRDALNAGHRIRITSGQRDAIVRRLREAPR